MKYVLAMLIFASATFGQDVLIGKDPDGAMVTLNMDTILYREDKAIFKAKIFTDDKNFANMLMVTRCVDYTFIDSITEGKREGIEFLMIGTKVQSAPDKTSKLYKILDLVCKNPKRPAEYKLEAAGRTN